MNPEATPDSAVGEEHRLVAAAHKAAHAFPSCASSASPDWKSFCFGFASEIYPWIDRGEAIEAVRAVLSSIADLCLTRSPAGIAQERLQFLIGAIRGREALRDSDGLPIRPKCPLSKAIPETAKSALQAVWNEEDDRFRQAQHGY